MKKIGITGASGHVGANLVRRLLKEDLTITVLKHKNGQAFKKLDVRIVEGDLNNVPTLENFCDGLEVVIHLAARISIGSNSYEALEQINVTGTKNLVTVAKKAGVKKFIHFSTIDAFVHPAADFEMDESSPLALESDKPYEKTKSVAEDWVRKQNTENFKVVVFNPTAILGPFDYQPSLLGDLIIRLYNNQLPALIPGGYDFVDVRDVCEAVCSSIVREVGGEKYILSGNWYSVIDFALLLEKVSGKKISMRKMPMWAAWIGLPFIQLIAKLSGKHPLYTRQSLEILQSGSRNISHHKAQHDLGYRARPLAESLKDTVEWFKENNYIKQ